MSDLKVTSFDELKEYAKGDIVVLPPFGSGQSFVARLKRPSLMVMVKENKIANPLLQITNDLFYGVEEERKKGKNFMKDSYEVFELVAKESFVEPTYQQIMDAGLKLTDQQLIFIFNYAQKGLMDLEFFRTDKQD